MKKTFTQRLREAAAGLDRFTAKDMLTPLGLMKYADIVKVRSVIRELVKTGEILILEKGVYRLVGTVVVPDVKSRVYRAMYAAGRFSARSVAMITDADVSYVRMLIRDMTASGAIVRAGSERNPRGKKEAVFFIRHRDQFYLENVK